MAKTTTTQPTGGLGEFFSGRYYPTSTALDPEVEATLRARYSDAYALLARTENQWKTEVIESHSNVQVALMNAYAKSMQVAASSAMAGATSQRAVADMIKSLNSTYANLLNVSGGELPKDVDKGFNDASTVLTQGFSAKNTALLGELTNMSDQEAKNHIASEYGGVIQKLFGNPNASTVSLHATSGTPLGQMYNIRTKARGIVGGQADAAYTQLMAQLLSSDDAGLKRLGATLGQEKILGDHGGLVNSFIENGLMIKQSNVYRRTGEGEQAARQDREYGRKSYEEQLEYARSLGAGVPPQMFAEFMSLHDAGAELVKKGPEAYAAGLGEMKSPAEFEKARSVLDEGVKSLSPTDKLTGSVRNWFAMPGFSRWAAINGFKTPLAATRYASKHPSEFAAFVRLNETDPDISLEELQGRMRQEGAFRTKGPVKTKYLSKPIERALGVGFTPPAEHRVFPGDVSVKQLEGAIKYVDKELEDPKKDQTTSVQGQSILPAEDFRGFPGEAEDQTKVTPRPATPDGVGDDSDEVRAFKESLTPEAQALLGVGNAGLDSPVDELTGSAKKRFLKSLKRRAQMAKERIDPESTGRTTIIAPRGHQPLPKATQETVAAQDVAEPPRRRNWGSFATSWAKKNPEEAKVVEKALDDFWAGKTLTDKQLEAFNRVPPGVAMFTPKQQYEAQERVSKLEEGDDIAVAINNLFSQPPTTILPTADPESESGPPLAGYPTGSVDPEVIKEIESKPAATTPPIDGVLSAKSGVSNGLAKKAKGVKNGKPPALGSSTMGQP